MKTSDTVSAIAAALVKAQAVMHGATKDAKNPAFKSSYASLSSVIEAARGPLTENGIAFLQAPGVFDEGGIPITTTLVHTSGEWISSTLVLPVAKRDPQGVGSAITYGCRYSLMAMLGLPPVDDDGNAATEQTYGWKEQRPSSPQVSAPPVPAKGTDTPSPAPSDRTIANALIMSLKSARTEPDLGRWLQDNQDVIDALPDVLKEEVRAAYRVKLLSLRRAA
jgi:hypothetical protein